MSTIPWPVAVRWARSIQERVIESAERVAIVGSIRREKEQVGDIELLIEPTMRVEQGDLFSQGPRPDTQGVVEELLGQDSGRSVIKGGSRYVQMRLAGDAVQGETKLDLFFCHPPASWGALKVIRTGPSDLGRLIVTELRERGWRMKDGAIWCPRDMLYHLQTTDLEVCPNKGREIEGVPYERVSTPEEEDVFEAVGLEYVPPERRDELAETLERRAAES
mgnify:CR=1 FL=1